MCIRDRNDIVVHDINASRTHAELRLEPQGVWTITDLGSTNGTLVNGAEIATHPLREGDRITIGMTKMCIRDSIQFLVAGLLGLAAGLALEPMPNFAALGADTWTSLAYLAVFASCVALLLSLIHI